MFKSVFQAFENTWVKFGATTNQIFNFQKLFPFENIQIIMCNSFDFFEQYFYHTSHLIFSFLLYIFLKLCNFWCFIKNFEDCA